MTNETIDNLKDEVWILNNGYEVSNKGRIIGKKGKLLNCKPNKDGYLQCSITFDDGFHVGNVHRAVAYLFLGKPKEGQEVNHKDGNKKNNCVENLEWVTKKENQDHEALVLCQKSGENNYLHKLTDEKVIEIYNLCKSGTILYKNIAEMYGTTASKVSNIARGKAWRYLKLKPLPNLVRGSRKNGI